MKRQYGLTGTAMSTAAYLLAKRKRFDVNKAKLVKYKVKGGHRKAKSNTKTKTKTKNKYTKGNVTDHTGVSGVADRIVVNAKRHKNVSGPALKYFESNNFVLNGGPGKQTVSDSIALGTITQWITSSGIGFQNFQSFFAYFNLNPYRNATNSITGVSAPTTDRLVMETVKYDMEITNFSTASAQMEIYYLRAKRDLKVGPTQEWNYSLISEGQGYGVTANTGANPGTHAAETGGVMNREFPGQDPRQCSYFNKNWAVLRKRTVLFAGGATEVVKANIIMNQLGMQENFAELSAQVLTYPKGCFHVMLVTRGQVVADVSAASTNTATFSTNQFGVIFTKNFRFRTVDGNAARLNFTYGVNDVPQFTTLANQKQVTSTDTAASVVQLD